MGLNDIWRNVSKEIGFYTKETFQNVPAVPGVYAWFYPLRILTKDANAFVNEVNAVLNYDSGSRGVPKLQSIFTFKWEQVAVDLEFGNRQFEMQKFEDLWNVIIDDEKRFELLRQSIMKASIFMPPLYVGKTVNLNTRCGQHVEGT